MKKALSFSLHLLIISSLFASCGSIGVIIQGGGSTTPPPPPMRPSYQSLGIEPGHLPPPGSCRVWYPNESPGQQPPPTSCENALREAPLGTWVLSRDRNDPNVLVVREIINSHPRQFKESQYRIVK